MQQILQHQLNQKGYNDTMQFNTHVVQTIDGYIPQIYFDGMIVWEGDYAYEEICDAQKKAIKHLRKTLASLFA